LIKLSRIRSAAARVGAIIGAEFLGPKVNRFNTSTGKQSGQISAVLI
jgi:hypothetical protein